jgi:hypothetical protein
MNIRTDAGEHPCDDEYQFVQFVIGGVYLAAGHFGKTEDGNELYLMGARVTRNDKGILVDFSRS